MSSNVLNGFRPEGTIPGDATTPLTGIVNPCVLNGPVYVKNELVDLSGGGSFPLENTVFVEDGGTGSGTRANPFGSFQDAIDSLGTPGVPSLVKSDGVGVFDENLSITSDNIFIIAPAATLLATTGDALTINAAGATSIGVQFLDCASGDSNSINIVNADGVGLDIRQISGDIQTDSGVSVFLNNEGLVGDIIPNNVADVIRVNCLNHFGFVAAGTENQIRGKLGTNYYGTSTFIGTLAPKRKSQTQFLGDTTLTDTFAGRTISTNFGANGVITLPEDATEDLPDGWTCEVLQSTANTVTFITEGTDVLLGGLNTISAQGGRAIVMKVESGLWSVSGNVTAV